MARQDERELTWSRAAAAISHQRFRNVTSPHLGGTFASQACLNLLAWGKVLEQALTCATQHR